MRPKRGAGRKQAGALSVVKRGHCVCDPEACTRASASAYGRYYGPEGYGRYYGPEGYGRYYGPEGYGRYYGPEGYDCYYGPEGYDCYYGPEGYDCYYGPEGYGPDPIHPNHDPEGYDHYYDPEDYDHYYDPEDYDHYYDPEDYDHYGASDDHWHKSQPKHDLRIQYQYGFQAVRPQGGYRPVRRHSVFNTLWGDRYLPQQLIRPMFRYGYAPPAEGVFGRPRGTECD